MLREKEHLVNIYPLLANVQSTCVENTEVLETECSFQLEPNYQFHYISYIVFKNVLICTHNYRNHLKYWCSCFMYNLVEWKRTWIRNILNMLCVMKVRFLHDNLSFCIRIVCKVSCGKKNKWIIILFLHTPLSKSLHINMWTCFTVGGRRMSTTSQMKVRQSGVDELSKQSKTSRYCGAFSVWQHQLQIWPLNKGKTY